MAHLPESSTSIEVFALPTGKLYLPDRWLFEDGNEDIRSARQHSPDYSFLIHHPSGRKVLFDLGMRKDLENHPPIIVDEYPYISPDVPMDAAEILNSGPIPQIVFLLLCSLTCTLIM
ncbi:hypothetical protein N7471_001897 [Penicillium samsonianum]|uniref:uncharacterized protein n=1 Tax=Penicillium samsonianum TaxID=1882272 RepID=UPI0025498A82|nr:uncharacterized protein N7471_001897 [Penicillium samsonianum]KAJ6142444.1 hypothetical protein N7471_001897 [Penicillium samsonianum]